MIIDSSGMAGVYEKDCRGDGGVSSGNIRDAGRSARDVIEEGD